jgi:hypothetical protein
MLSGFEAVPHLTMTSTPKKKVFAKKKIFLLKSMSL